MAEDKTKPASTESEVKATHVRPANIPSVYVNGSNLAVGPFEVRLYVSEVTPVPGQDNAVTVTDKLCLVMSPEFAKALADQLTNIMTSYEKDFGKLRASVTTSVSPTVFKPTPA